VGVPDDNMACYSQQRREAGTFRIVDDELHPLISSATSRAGSMASDPRRLGGTLANHGVAVGHPGFPDLADLQQAGDSASPEEDPDRCDQIGAYQELLPGCWCPRLHRETSGAL